MAEQSIEKQMEIGRKVLDKNWRRLKTYLNPDEITDLNTEFELFSFVERRDIKEANNTTEKNHVILTKVRSKGIDGYNDFKERLKTTNQCKLVDLLTLSEKGLDTQEIEQELDEMAEQNLLLSSSEYYRLKKDLKDALIEFYKTRHSKVFLSPLFDERDTPLASFYIRPELNLIVPNQKINDERKPLKSLSEMFKTENLANREIYVIADAGLGKTAFSNYLANLWCQGHCQDENIIAFFAKDDVVSLQEFDFLFLLLLRESYDLCAIDDLIYEKLVSNLGLQDRVTREFLLKVLKNEKCLVILDGLDEWSHPENKCYRSPRSIPHRNDREKCTFLTTTRPWKLGVLNLNSRELGIKVELTKPSENSIFELSEKILQRLKFHSNTEALKNEVKKFLREVNSRENAELVAVPLLLMYTICLWCDGVLIGNSKSELYINIVEFLLAKTIKRNGELQQSNDPFPNDIPECFNEYENCKKNFKLLMSVGNLAFYRLSNKTREHTLVFDGSVAKNYLTPDEMTFMLHSGILSETTTNTLTKRISKISFSHKTVQEFFAAIFVSSQIEAQKTMLERLRTVQDILDMSMVCCFLSKMNTSLMCSMLKYIPSVVNEDESTVSYRSRTDHISDNPLCNIQNMFCDCVKEMSESESIQLCLQDLFIDIYSRDSKQIQRLSKQNAAKIKSVYINTSYTSSNLSEIVDFYSLQGLHNIQKFYFCGEKEEADINLVLFPSLQTLTLRSGKWTNNERDVNENLAQLQNIKNLRVEYFTFSHKILGKLFNFISGQTSLKVLTLKWLYCTEHGYDCIGLYLDLSKHSILSKLELLVLPTVQLNIRTKSLVDFTLWGSNLDVSLLLMASEMLNIESVELGDVEISAGSFQNFVDLLGNLSQSVTVKMDAVKPETEFEHVKKYISSSHYFDVVPDGHWFKFKTRKPSNGDPT